MPFYQEPPADPDLWLQDDALRAAARDALPPDVWPAWEARFAALGRRTASALAPLARAAEAEPPRLVKTSPWGRPIDRIEASSAWRELVAESARLGLVGTGHDLSLGTWRRAAQATLLHLFAASSATASCPVAMTDAAATVLRRSGDPDIVAEIVPRLLSTDPDRAWSSGQWMTERPGGSDVSRTETIARSTSDGWRLSGWKWFTSATEANVALTLARTPDGALSLFLVRMARDADGSLPGVRIERLKDKLGTRAMPTAELVLDNAPAAAIGPLGRGVATIAPMLNVTRWHNAIASASGMRRAVALAVDYAHRREASGRRLVDLPLHAHTLAGLDAQAAAATALVVRMGSLLGQSEDGALAEGDARALRALLPVAKATLGKAAVSVASEAIECFGGAGYIEDTDLPRLLRDAQVLPIWEGTTNVLALDLQRAQAKEGAHDALLDWIAPMLPAALTPALDRARALAHHPDARQARTAALWTGDLAQAAALHALEGDSARCCRFADDRLGRLQGTEAA
jgi:alkylation response protein AidB-like acyl-CoA dehydrogenase